MLPPPLLQIPHVGTQGFGEGRGNCYWRTFTRCRLSAIHRLFFGSIVLDTPGFHGRGVPRHFVLSPHGRCLPTMLATKQWPAVTLLQCITDGVSLWYSVFPQSRLFVSPQRLAGAPWPLGRYDLSGDCLSQPFLGPIAAGRPRTGDARSTNSCALQTEIQRRSPDKCGRSSLVRPSGRRSRRWRSNIIIIIKTKNRISKSLFHIASTPFKIFAAGLTRTDDAGQFMCTSLYQLSYSGIYAIGLLNAETSHLRCRSIIPPHPLANIQHSSLFNIGRNAGNWPTRLHYGDNARFRGTRLNRHWRKLK